ncbi:CRISPR system Cascade subunit CasB [Saccharopolyspora phatthalungensis]|uniref:CRISPR system Cascade subunit CasB n=1 Tax=Saccharopolyspora phatthalungensis TaxID=664693 RepID=A0A840Q4F7_9PSEU|nr:CRISPR system Cascade subunit CasB [Saccharopolyspora phatthalungensis]
MTDDHDRRRAFISNLYQLGDALHSHGHDARTADARKTLAQLRRSLTREYQPAALDFLFEQNPPAREEETWLLVAGLFALAPSSPNHGERRLPLGAAMRKVDQGASEARMRQLLSVAPNSVAHYVRQAVQLLRGHNIALNFESLLDDLVTLSSAPPNSRLAHQVRMKWARDFHRAIDSSVHADTDDRSGGASA